MIEGIEEALPSSNISESPQSARKNGLIEPIQDFYPIEKLDTRTNERRRDGSQIQRLVTVDPMVAEH